jgi:hypothetical protein
MEVYESTDIGIGDDAPVTAASETLIAAERELVWSLLTDFEGWPAWNRDVTCVYVDGPVVDGMTFRWKAGPMRIESKIQRLRSPRLVAWTGRTLGITAVHVWNLEAVRSGTIVRTRETWDGRLVRLFRKSMQKTLQGSLDRGLRYLKGAAERTVSAGGHASVDGG